MGCGVCTQWGGGHVRVEHGGVCGGQVGWRCESQGSMRSRGAEG